MTPQRKLQLRQDTAKRLRETHQQAIARLRFFHDCAHCCSKDERYAYSRRAYFFQAKCQIEVVRKAIYALEAASPDSENARRPLEVAA